MVGNNLNKQNWIHETIQWSKSGNVWYYSVLNRLSSTLPKNVKIEIYRSIILPAFLYGCETWSLILREESRLKVFENRVPRRIHVFGPKRDEVTGEWRKLHNKELNDLYSSQTLFSWSNREWDGGGGGCSTYGRKERFVQFWWRDLGEEITMKI
jgi:hypothetical protein